jgi:predicted enzyme related to lactoylglutathione lyase
MTNARTATTVADSSARVREDREDERSRWRTTVFKDAEAFSGFSVDPLAAAHGFYGGVLGLDVTDDGGMLNIHLASGARILIYPKPNHTPASYTMLNFLVPDIEAAVDRLNRAGIEMIRYDEPKTDPKGIFRGEGPLIAWFNDPAGNILSVIEEERRPG